MRKVCFECRGGTDGLGGWCVGKTTWWSAGDEKTREECSLGLMTLPCADVWSNENQFLNVSEVRSFVCVRFATRERALQKKKKMLVLIIVTNKFRKGYAHRFPLK